MSPLSFFEAVRLDEGVEADEIGLRRSIATLICCSSGPMVRILFLISASLASFGEAQNTQPFNSLRLMP
jgi:hypothetical protein